MLQAVRRAHRSAVPRHAPGAVLAALAARQRSFARSASTSVVSEDVPDAQDAKAARDVARAATLVDPVTIFYEHPRKVLDAVKFFVDRGSARFSGGLLTQLAANPIVENRLDAMRTLHALPDAERNANQLPLLQPSHADAIAQLSRLPEGIRITKSLDVIFKARYEDALFVNAADLISVLSICDPAHVVTSYLEVLPLHLHRLQLHWERDALAGRGTTAEVSCAAAVEQLLLIEDHLRERYPTVLGQAHVRGCFVRAFAAARAPEHAHRHRIDLLKLTVLFSAGVDESLSAARDLVELAAVWAESRPRLATNALRSKSLGGVLRLHYARLGGTGAPHKFFGLKSSAVGEGVHWATLAREAESQGAQLPADFVVPEPFKVLRANGMDWDGVAFLLRPFSPFRRLLTSDRMLR